MRNKLKAIVFAGLMAVGCAGDTDDDSTTSSGGTGGTPDCDDCDFQEYFFLCECIGPGAGEAYSYVCAEPEDAQGNCNSACRALNSQWSSQDPQYGACSSHEPTGSCVGWDPSEKVRFANGVHYVDVDFFEDLLDDPAPLWSCDETTIETNGSAFYVSGEQPGELLYELGLRNGDIIEELNELPLDSYASVAEAFIQLWSVEGETEYELKVMRSAGPAFLYYELTTL